MQTKTSLGFQHDRYGTVSCSENFIDPISEDHTQSIELLWKLKKQALYQL